MSVAPENDTERVQSGLLAMLKTLFLDTGKVAGPKVTADEKRVSER